MLTAAEEEMSLFLCQGFQLHVFYSAVEKCGLATTLETERFAIPAFSVFVEHSHMQHSGAGWDGSSCLRCHAYNVPSHLSLKDALFFAYGSSFSIHPGTTY